LIKLKHFVHAYSEWIKHVLVPLGPWGMLALAAVDGSFMGMPLDAIFVYYVYTDRSRFLLYVLLGAAGSALGSIVLYIVGYTGGEVLLRKRLSPQRFEKNSRILRAPRILGSHVSRHVAAPHPFQDRGAGRRRI